MIIGLVFAAMAVLCGVCVQRTLRLPLAVAPVSGLAAMAVATSWTTVLRAPPVVATAVIVGVALCGGVLAARALPLGRNALSACRVPALVLIAAALIPALVLGGVFAGIEVPVSTHDGAFHVEMIDRLRHGVAYQTWYPLGFHGSVAAVLGLVPWLDSARGTAEAGQGLALLAPLAVCALGLALGADALLAAVAAVILALTWTYPYDYHLWGGWPQGMGVLLLIGLWVSALRWIAQPRLGWALLGALFAAAIVLSHGTEVYSGSLGLAVIAIARWRWLDRRPLVRHLPLAIAIALVLIGPYLVTLLGWASAGAATGVGEAIAEYSAANPEDMGRGDWLQFGLGAVGAASPADLPLRLVLIGFGLRLRQLRLATALWLTFLALLVLVDFFDLAPIRRLFVLTYPWLVDHRPRQVAVLFASLLSAGGVLVGVDYLRRLRERHFTTHPDAWRRLAIACAVALAFFAEGSAVSIYKRLADAAADQNVFTTDDGAAMAWLRQHAQRDEVVANNGANDAGIWVPYKATIPILLPRSGTPDTAERTPIAAHLLDLTAAPGVWQAACALHVDYVYVGGRPLPIDPPVLPDRAALERAPDLVEVFASGEAAIFRVEIPCG